MSSFFLSKQLESLSQGEETTKDNEEPKATVTHGPWWDSIPELAKIEAHEEKFGKWCSCRDEGSQESQYMICSVHPPKGIKHMRAIVHSVMNDYYEQGRKDALREVRDFILGSSWNKTLEQTREEK